LGSALHQNLNEARLGGRSINTLPVSRQLLKIAAAVAVTTGAGVIGYQSLYPSVPSKGYGGISCATFRKNMDKYIQKGLEDQQLVAKMDKHLELQTA